MDLNLNYENVEKMFGKNVSKIASILTLIFELTFSEKCVHYGTKNNVHIEWNYKTLFRCLHSYISNIIKMRRCS